MPGAATAAYERKKEGLTSVSPFRDDVGDALSTQKETNYPIHAESPNRDPEERNTRCRVKIQNTDRGRGRSSGEKVSLKSGTKRCTGGRSTESERKRIPDSWSSKEEGSTSVGRFEERYGEEMLFRRAKRMRRTVGNEKIAKIGRLIIL